MPLRWSWRAFILGTPCFEIITQCKWPWQNIFIFIFLWYLIDICLVSWKENEKKWHEAFWKNKMPIVWVLLGKRKDDTWHFKKWNAYSCEHFGFWNALQIFNCKYIKIFYPNSINNKGKNKRVFKSLSSEKKSVRKNPRAKALSKQGA